MTKARDLGDNAQNTKPKVINAKGDLIVGTGSDAADRLAVSDNGSTLVADSSTSTGLRWQGSQAAAKNGVINGGFDIWQRGTSSTLNVGYGSADRWYQFIGSGTGTYARESSIVPSGSQYAMRFTASSAGTGHSLTQYFETATIAPFINKTVVVSLQVAASTSTAMSITLSSSTTVDAGSGASWSTVTATSGGTATPTSTTYVTLTGVYAIPSNAQSLRLTVGPTSTTANSVVCYYGNVQLELGSVATSFTRAGGTLAGEFQACCRYYYRHNATGGFSTFTNGMAYSSTQAIYSLAFPVPMRIKPTALEQSGTASHYGTYRNTTAVDACTAVPTYNNATTTTASFVSTSANLVAGNATIFLDNNTSSAYLGWSAEL